MPTTAPGRLVVETVSVELPVTTTERAFVAACCGEETSVTRTVKLKVPVLEGVPLRTPVVAFKLRPAGSAPAVTDHAYGEVPPEANSVCEYPTPRA